MSLPSWESVLVTWVNCLNLHENSVKHIRELKDGQVFISMLNLLDKTSLCNEKPAEPLDIVNIFLKREYPGFYLKVDHSDEEIIYLCSIFLFHCVLKVQSVEVMEKMYSLNSDMQTYIRNFLEKLLLYNGSINRTILQEAITEHQKCDTKCIENDSFSNDSSPVVPFSSTPKRKPRVIELLESPYAQQLKLLSERKRDLDRLKNELEQEQAEKSEMQECIKELDSQLKQQTQRLNQKNAEIKKLREEMREICATPKKGEPLHEIILKEEVKSLEKCVSALQEEIGSVQEEKSALTMKLAKLEGQCTFWQNKAKEAIASSELLKQDLKDKEDQLFHLREVNDDLQKFVQEMKTGRSRHSSDFECSPLGRWSSPGSRSAENMGTVIDLQLQEKEEENATLRNEVQSYVIKEQDLRKEVQNLQEQVQHTEMELSSLKAENSDLMQKVEKLVMIEEQCTDLQSQLANKDVELKECICAMDKLTVVFNDLQQKYQVLQSTFDTQNADLCKLKNDAEETTAQLEQKSHECLTLLQESLKAKERIEFVEKELNIQIKISLFTVEAECLEKSEEEYVDVNMEECVEKLSAILHTLKNNISKRDEEILELKLAYQNITERSAAQCEEIESLYVKESNLILEQTNLKSEIEYLKEQLEGNKTTLLDVQQEKDMLFLQLKDLKAENEKQSLMLEKLEDLEKHVGILEEERDVMDACNLELESNINDLKSKQHSLERNMIELKQQHEKELTKALNDISCLQAKNDNLEKMKLQLEADTASLKKQLEVLGNEGNELINQNCKYSEQILHMTSEIESIRLHVRNVENDNLQAKVDLEVNKKLYAEVKGSKDALEEQLNKRITDCNMQITILEKEKKSLESTLEDLLNVKEAEDKCSKEKIAELEKNVESLAQENCMKIEELIEVKRELEAIKENLKKSNQDILEKQGIIDELIEMKESCSQQADELAKQLSLLKHELEDVRLESKQIKERKDKELEMLQRQKDEEMKILQRSMEETKEERNDLLREVKTLEKQNKELIETCKDVEVLNNSLQEVRLKLISTLELKNIAEESKLNVEASNVELKMLLKQHEEDLEKLKGNIKEHRVQHLNYEEMCVKFSQETSHIKECFTSIALMEDKLEDSRRELCKSLDELALNIEALASDTSVGYSELLAIQYQQTELEEIFNIIQATHTQTLQKIRDFKFATFERVAEYAELHSKSMCIMDTTVPEHDLLPIKHISYKELLKYEDLKLNVHASTKELKSEMSDIISVMEKVSKKCSTLVSKCQSLHRRESILLLGSSQGSLRNLTSETKSRYMKNFIECIGKEGTSDDDDGWNLDDSLETQQEVASCAAVYKDKLTFFPSPTLKLNIQRKAAFNIRVRKELRQLNQEISHLKKQNESLNLFLQEEQKSNAELKRNLAELEDSKRTIKSEKEAALSMKAKLEMRISTLESDLSEMNSYRTEASQLKEVCKALNLKYDELKSQLAKNDNMQSGRNRKYTEEDMAQRISKIRVAYEEKLEKLKLRMKDIFEGELETKTRKLKEEVSKLQAVNKQYKEKIASYEENMKILQSQEWEIGDRYLVAKEENKRYEDIIKASKQHVTLIPAEEQVGENRKENIPERKQNMSFSQEWQKKMNLSVMHSMDVIDESVTYTRRQSIYKSLPSGMLFNAEDEEGEEFNTTNLADLKAGRCQPPAIEGSRKARLSELQFRNSLCPPHLKSSYPAETQFYDPRDYKDEDLKLGCAVDVENLSSLSTSLLLPEEKHHKKDIGQTSYMRPGPPTPGKNCRRYSLQGAECLTPRAPLRESNDGASVRRIATPNRLKSLFSKSNRRNDENSPVTPRTRRISNLFRKPTKNNH